jgi:hypothetical protein
VRAGAAYLNFSSWTKVNITQYFIKAAADLKISDMYHVQARQRYKHCVKDSGREVKETVFAAPC